MEKALDFLSKEKREGESIKSGLGDYGTLGFEEKNEAEGERVMRLMGIMRLMMCLGSLGTMKPKKMGIWENKHLS